MFLFFFYFRRIAVTLRIINSDWNCNMDCTEEDGNIAIYGAREHNLKNLDLIIPRDKLTVITGLSGSGKSSLAFDTIYAEGQRRYLETFSAYARRFLGGIERPDVDKITGLSPVISIEQKTTNKKKEGRYPKKRLMTEEAIMGQLQPIVIDTHAIGNPWLNYSVYLNNTILPGVLQLVIFMITVFSIGTEIKQGTARKWLSMGNNSLFVSIIGKLLPQTVIFTLMGVLLCVTLYGFNAFPLHSGWMPMLVAMFFLVIASQAVGVFMIGTLPTLRLGLSFACLFGMISFSIVGFSYPLLAMDPTLQALGRLFPLRHYFLIYVDQALNGRSLFYTWSEYVWLLGFLILPFLIGKNLKRALLYLKYIP